MGGRKTNSTLWTILEALEARRLHYDLVTFANLSQEQKINIVYQSQVAVWLTANER